MRRRMLGPACVRVVGGSSRLSWTRENAAEAPCSARPGRCRPRRFDGGGCTVGSVAGLVGDGAETARLEDGLVPAGPGLGLRDRLGLRDGLGLEDGLGDGDGQLGGNGNEVGTGHGDSDGHSPAPEPAGNGDAVGPAHGHQCRRHCGSCGRRRGG
jgi:hypothetical protein